MSKLQMKQTMLQNNVVDIITYVNFGGNLENLTANNVYIVIKNK